MIRNPNLFVLSLENNFYYIGIVIYTCWLYGTLQLSMYLSIYFFNLYAINLYELYDNNNYYIILYYI